MPSTLNQPRLARREDRPAFLSQVALPRSVQTMEQARPLFDGVRLWLAAQGLRELRDARIPLALKDRVQMRAAGLTWSHGYHVVGIDIRKGPPPILITGIMAHEWMEVWLKFVHAPLAPSGHPDEWKREGLCELVRYEFYKAAQTRYTPIYMRIIQKRMPPTYRLGYRRQHERFRGMSLREIAQYVRRARRLT